MSIDADAKKWYCHIVNSYDRHGEPIEAPEFEELDEKAQDFYRARAVVWGAFPDKWLKDVNVGTLHRCSWKHPYGDEPLVAVKA